jgi:phosphatidylinositol-3,4,5-trisphosphate 3-phosphatase/dual-specificity protein phosphatase PTEN
MNYLRTIVSGKKKRFIDEKYNLDLSYITSRIIAMAFPASGIEKIYRNSIDSVSKFLKERHKENYIVINLSGKKYDYSKFNNRVLEYEWVDHHAPPLKILFQICEKIQKFLSGIFNIYY